jgi:ATP-dependent Lon protease
METVIPLAGLQPIYSVADVDRAREDSSARRNEGLKGWYDRMRELGGSRYIVKPSTHKAVDDLYDASPNFAEVIDDLRKFLALAVSGNEAVQFTPMLLLGEPGLGKTYFAKRLAQALGTGFEFVSMSSLTAGWVLTGASSQWHNARPGKVAQTLIEGDYANPVVVLDEVDKAGGDARYDPMGALYTLLERDTASHFKDEFIDVDMDASHILWVATANDETVIPEPILSRMNVYAIERPDAEGSRRIAVAVYREILEQHNWPFPAEPDDAVVDKLAAIPPRDMRKLLLDAFGTAQLAARDHLVPEDIDTRKLCGRRARVGF